MVEVEAENLNITIPQSWYEQLLDIRTRVNVVVERIIHEGYMSTEDILWILGTDSALEKAEELRKENEAERKQRAKEIEGLMESG